MNPVILRPNAAPVYSFLTLIQSQLSAEETLAGRKILDCGAGGLVPPVAVFAEQGMEAHGIDISEGQIAKARAFCEQTGIPVALRVGNMRTLPYEDESFDYVYEHYSVCHLNPADTAATVAEMQRVLKSGGVAHFGVISTDSWPPSSFGTERAPGEYWHPEQGEESLHALFSDRQVEALLAGWQVLRMEKAVRILRERGEETTEEEWRSLYREAPAPCTEEEWTAQYPSRVSRFTYVHLNVDVRKPLLPAH